MKGEKTMKTIKVKLEPYKSPFYPVKALWKINSVSYSAVFETVQQAKNYVIGKYINVCFSIPKGTETE